MGGLGYTIPNNKPIGEYGDFNIHSSVDSSIGNIDWTIDVQKARITLR